jgi:hypothetical protein
MRGSQPRLLAFWLAALLSASAASADPVPVANPGFEDLYLGSNLPPEYGGDVPTGSFPVGPPPSGWTAYYASGQEAGMYIGVLNPGTTADHAPAPPCFPAGAPEGDNVVLLYMDGDDGGGEYGVQQQLAATLEAHTTYTLTARVGNIASCAGLVVPYTGFFDLDGFPGYRVQLLAGGVVVAEDAGALSPGEGQFATATVQVSTTGAPAQLGEPLAVRLVNRNQPDLPGVTGLEVDFDDVRLEAAPIERVPVLPLGVAALALAMAGSGAARIRRLRSAR